MTEHKSSVFKFDDIVVRENEFAFTRAGETVMVEPTAFRVLLYLLRNPGRLVTKDEIMAAVWRDTAVSDNSLTRSVATLRRLLDDSSREPRYIATVQTLGYRFLVPVETLEEPGNNSKETQNERSFSSNGRAKSRRALRLVLLAVVGALLLVLVVIGKNRLLPTPRRELRQAQLTTNSSDNPVGGAAISGDGKYLLYADNASIHIKAVETGETRDLPNPTEFGKRHVFWGFIWFPDSVRFLAVSVKYPNPNQRTTWLGSAMGGSLRKLRDDTHAWAISPDGSRIAFSPPGDREVWVMDATGENGHRLFDAGNASSFNAVQWSPDGTKFLDLRQKEDSGHIDRVIETRDREGSIAPAILLNDERLKDLHWLRDGRIIYLLGEEGHEGQVCNYWATRLHGLGHAFTSESEQITHNDKSCMENASSTRDGKKLVFTRYTASTTIDISDLEAGGTRITPPRHFILTQGLDFPNAWTADSRDLIFTSNRDQSWGVYRQTLSGGTAIPIFIEHPRTPDIQVPVVSPDGNWIFYFRSPGTAPPNVDLMEAPINGGQPSKLFSGNFIDEPRCSHAPANLCAVAWIDKGELVFTTFDGQLGLGHELARAPVDPKQGHTWVLSPDGMWIALHEPASSSFDLVEWKTRKRRTVRVEGWNTLNTMDWAPDGKGLFMSAVDPASTLLHVDLKGHASVLWEPQGYDSTWAVASPDGRHVAMPFWSIDSNVWMLENF